MQKILLFSSLFISYYFLSAQTIFPFNAPVIENGQTIKNPYAGGLNQPQFSTIDLNFDGNLVVAGFNDRSIKVWEACERRDEMTLNIHSDEVRALACTRDGRHLISGSFDKTIAIFNLETQEEEWRIKNTEENPSEVNTMAKYLNFMFSGHRDGSFKFWSIETKKIIGNVCAHRKDLYHITVCESSHLAASGSEDKQIIVWLLKDFGSYFILADSTHAAIALSFMDNGKKLVSGGDDFNIRIWDIESRTEERCLNGHSSAVWSIVISEDDNIFFSASMDKTIKLWSLTTHSNEFTFQGHTKGIRRILIKKSTNHLISASFDFLINFWDIKSKSLDFSLEGHKA